MKYSKEKPLILLLFVTSNPQLALAACWDKAKVVLIDDLKIPMKTHLKIFEI